MNGRETKRLRERALFLYSCALVAGDAEALENVLTMAENDPALANMLTEVETDFAEQQQEASDISQMERVRSLLSEYLGSAYISGNEDQDVPPLTIGDVAGKLKTEAGAGQLAAEAMRVTQMEIAKVPLPQDLTKAGVRRFFEQLGITISRTFADQFRNIGIEMQMRHDRQMMRFSATRKQNNRGVTEASHQSQEQDEPEMPT
ncbi:MAG: hypothetical protein JWL77_3089 [Chthonomonadaceae bacterium]|nr:hypothetical protein [Chthonomonadaceae bacterium]